MIDYLKPTLVFVPFMDLATYLQWASGLLVVPMWYLITIQPYVNYFVGGLNISLSPKKKYNCHSILSKLPKDEVLLALYGALYLILP